MADVVDPQVAIRPQCRPRELEVASLAARQHGVVAHRHLVALGLSKAAIQRRVRAGRLHVVYRGVYAVGHPSLTREGWWMAAVLACGPGAVLSHRCAAAHWGLRRGAPARVDVSVRGRSRTGQKGINLHLPRRLHARECAIHEGIPVTSVARTLLDLAETVQRHELERAFEEAERLRLLNLRAVEAVCAKNPGRRGLKPLTALLTDLRPAPDTRSELERLFVDLIRTHDLPPPLLNTLVEGFEVDALWSSGRLIVELDSRAHHQTAAAFERDRARDAKLQLAGYRVVRITYRQLTRSPTFVAQTVRSLIATR